MQRDVSESKMYARAPPIVKLPHLFYTAKNPQLPGFETKNLQEKNMKEIRG